LFLFWREWHKILARKEFKLSSETTASEKFSKQLIGDIYRKAAKSPMGKGFLETYIEGKKDTSIINS
jgi:hypothetical protein